MRQVRRLRYGMRRAIRVTALRPSVSVWSTVAIATAIVMVGIALLGAQNIDRWAMRWRGGATMVAYLDAAVSDDRARAITTQLGDVPGFEGREPERARHHEHRRLERRRRASQ